MGEGMGEAARSARVRLRVIRSGPGLLGARGGIATWNCGTQRWNSPCMSSRMGWNLDALAELVGDMSGRERHHTQCREDEEDVALAVTRQASEPLLQWEKRSALIDIS